MNFEQFRTGVDVHREINLAVTHRGVCRSWSDPDFAEQCSERMPQSVSVDAAPAFVEFLDVCRFQVAVEDTNESDRNSEQRSFAVVCPLAIA